jgi:hypothetical protein
VKVQIGSSGQEYLLSKAMLCKHSKYFATMFNGDFKEGQENTAHLDLFEGVVSIRSFELLIQWMYVEQVIVAKVTPSEQIEALVEFARLADFCQVQGVEDLLAERIKAVMSAGTQPAPKNGWSAIANYRPPDTNTYRITSRAVRWASALAQGHAVRKMLATAAVEGFLRGIEHNHRFFKEIQEITGFGADVLNAVESCLSTLRVSDTRTIQFTDPISGENLGLGD